MESKIDLPPTDGNDQWSFAWQLTDEQLAAIKQEQLDYAKRHNLNWSTDFTCEGCTRKRICTLVYDLYNVNGDCLWEK